MSGFRSGGRVPVSQPQRRIYPSLDPGPSLPPPCAGHTCWSTPAGHALCRGTLELHPSPLPTEYEQQPAAVPSMEKKRTVYQMALSKKPQHGSLMPQPRPPASGDAACISTLLCALQSPMSSALRALEPWALHTITVPPTLLCFVIPGLCLLG